MTGETDALVGSFIGEPELQHPARGRIKGVAAFARFVAETRTWLAQHNVTIEDVNLVVARRRGVEEVVLHIDSDDGPIELPLAVAADRDEDARIIELRIRFSTWPLTGGHAISPPLPPRHRRAVRAVRGVLFQWRRHLAGALRGYPRRARLRSGVQPGRLGPDAAAPPRRDSLSTCAATAESSPLPASMTGGTFPDFTLPDHANISRSLSELQGDDPLILTLAPATTARRSTSSTLDL
jgi:hypothetical protein